MSTNMKSEIREQQVAIRSAILNKRKNVGSFRTERCVNPGTNASCEKKTEAVDNIILQIERQGIKP
jgi:hypothetical protein